jgi:predicted helicase
VGRGSFGYLIAQIAVETGIAPQALLELDSTMFANVIKVLNDRSEDIKRGQNRAKR